LWDSWLDALEFTTLISDGFLPFRYNVDQARRIGARHIVEPGGSIRSAKVQEVYDELGVTLTPAGLRLSDARQFTHASA